MKKSTLFLVVCLMFVASPTAKAQEAPFEDPLADLVGYLPKKAEGSSSLFFLDGRLWTCNDHGPLRLFALDTLSGSVDSVVDLGVRVYDLEEVALDSLYLYFGDFGDNRGSRSDLRILRLSRSDFASRRFRFDTIAFHYSERSSLMARNFDCEAFVAGADSLYLFTKQWLSQGSVCYALPKVPGSYAARRCFSLHTDGLVTGACFLPRLRTLVLVGYSLLVKPFVYVIDRFEADRFSQGRHRRTPLANPFASQTEGIASLDGLHFFLTRETLTLRDITRRAALLRLDLSSLPEESNIR